MGRSRGHWVFKEVGPCAAGFAVLDALGCLALAAAPSAQGQAPTIVTDTTFPEEGAPFGACGRAADTPRARQHPVQRYDSERRDRGRAAAGGRRRWPAPRRRLGADREGGGLPLSPGGATQ